MKVFDNYSNENNHNFTPDNNKKICSIDNSNIFFNSTCNIDKFDLSNKLWKQLSLNGDISIPDTNPLIKDVDSINTKVEIISQKVLKAPSIMKKRDFEGLRGGQRIIKIHGLLCFSVNYIALLKQEEMYIFQDKIPFSVAIDLPLKDSNQEDMIDFEYVISYCIEDIHVNSIMDKTLNLTTTFILLANKSFSKDNLCIDENYFKDFNTNCKDSIPCLNCKDSIPCLNCNEESQIVFKGIFSQDKIEDVSKDEDIKYFKRFESIEVLDLPKCNPNIIKILSVTTNIKILCQRVVKTPILDENLENKQVTGFALFIHFMLSQNIKYSSNTSCETIHYAIFNFPSSLYITLRDTTLISDKFKISYYIDDIYACILNERQIFINTSILFDTKLINCKSRPNNVLTFRGKEDNKIAIVEFYIDDGKLKIISTGDVSNADFSIKEYFSLQLDEISINKITSLNKNLKYKSVVHGNENADSFRKTLNNKDIKEGDIINLLCRERERISISNYQGQEEYHPKYFSQNFKISSNGLEANDPNILPNVITFKGEEDKDITIIRFNKDNLTLIVDSSGLISNQNFSQEVYFSFEIKDAFNVSKIKSQVMGNEDCDNFRNILNNQSFSYGDILTLEYKENNRVNITNYKNQENYNPNGISESYVLTNQKLLPIELVNNNSILIKGQSNEKISFIRFNRDTFSLMVDSFGIIANPSFKDKYYFSFELTEFNGTQKYKSIINGNQTADNFKVDLNNQSFNNGDIINLVYRERQRVSISNYQGQIEYNPKYFSESYKMTTNGLQSNNPNLLSNTITFKGKEDRDVAIIRLNTDTLKLIVDSSGLESNSDFLREVYFSLEIKENFTTSKIKSEVLGNQDADNFKTVLNNQPFKYGDILNLTYKENNRVNITNYNGNPNYNPSGRSEEYEITAEGLKPIKATNITIKGALDKKIALISFNKDTSSLILDSFGTIANSNFLNKYYFSFELTEPNGTQKYKSIINGNDTANNFKNVLNGKTFNNNDIINLTYRERQRVSISNYQGQSEYNPQYFSESYKIVDNELYPNTIDVLPNVITFKGKNDREITIIRFNKDKASLIVDSSGLEANLDFSTEVYLSLEITDAFNIPKIKNEVMGNQDADDFKNALTDYEFVYGDVLTLSYKENNKVIISNYEGTSNYNPSGTSESYEITIEGLKPKKSINNNNIIIYGLFDAKFATINFDNNKFVVISTGTQLVSNYEGMNVLKFSIKDKNFNGKKAMFLRGDDNATNLVNAINDTEFEVGDILRFKTIINIYLLISNYKGHINYLVRWGSSDFNLQITPNGLRPANFNYLKNTIILYRKYSNIKTVFFINFETSLLKLFANSSGGRINTSIFQSREYFKLILKSNTGTTKLNLTQLGNSNAVTFTDAIDEQSFSYGDTLRLICREPNMMVITNFNNQSEYNQSFYSDRYRISPNGLEPLSNTILENIITFKGDYYDRFTESTIIEVMCIIRFDVTEKILIVDSSGLKLKENPRYNEYFSVTLKKSSSTRPIRYSVSGNEDSDRFRNNFDTRSFEFGDVLTLTYVDNTNVEIAKFNGQDIYNPTGLESSYTITSSGLTLNP